MHLSTYSDLIRHLPCLDQAFETRKETWDRDHYQEHKDFDLFLQNTFDSRDTVILSRGDLFKKTGEDVKSAILSIILWGYPRNMRGDTFKSILEALPEIEELLSVSRQLDANGFSAICQQLRGKGIRLSTLSKFLYFFGFTLEGYRCLILDSRIIDVLNAKTFDELTVETTITEWNKENYYLDYLKMMKKVSQKVGSAVDQLELFLFQFGRNLKTTNTNKAIG